MKQLTFFEEDQEPGRSAEQAESIRAGADGGGTEAAAGDCQAETSTAASSPPRKIARRPKGTQTVSTVPPAQPVGATQAASRQPEPPPTYTYPFRIRYAAQTLELTGFVEGRAYTQQEIRDLLVQNGYVEFRDIEPEFHLHQDTNTLIITIRGSKKGAGFEPLPLPLLRQVEARFKATYAREGTEDRVLVYRSPSGILALVEPDMERGAGYVTCDLPLCLDVGGVLCDLVADLHSHHEMGAFWSAMDDANERIRGVLFGVFSWAGGQDRWLFRVFTGKKFKTVRWEEAVAVQGAERGWMRSASGGSSTRR